MVPCGLRAPLPGTGITAESPNIRRWLLESLQEKEEIQEVLFHMGGDSIQIHFLVCQ